MNAFTSLNRYGLSIRRTVAPFHHPTNRLAFTLIELLVVIAILALLAGLLIPTITASLIRSKAAACLSNQRQIGIAMVTYAAEHKGALPQSTHSVSTFRRENAWIYTLAPYLDDIDTIRICPAEPPSRKQEILERMGTSYILNDLVFDSPLYNDLPSVPANTLLMFILTEDRVISNSRDHIHGGEWTSFNTALNDIEPDRHRRGARATDRLKGSSNYLYADGRVASRPATWFFDSFTNGNNPAIPGESP